jgi:hypothetical protein
MAALVAADALAAKGEKVRLLAPERGLGGGFASIPREGRLLELGVRLLELSYEDTRAPPPLREYRPAFGAHRPYAALIERWVRDLLGDRVVEVARPQMFFDGRIVDDLYFTTDALALREALDLKERERIAGEAQRAQEVLDSVAGVLDERWRHELSVISTTEASRRNHGETFHDRFIAPIAEKVIAGGGDHVPATLRRKIWIPLFWPSTIVEACGEGALTFHPKRPFHTITPGGCGELVSALRQRILANGASLESAGRLESVRALDDGAIQLELSAIGGLRARRPVLGSAAGELFAAVGANYAPSTARSVICWLEAQPRDLTRVPSLLNIVDADVPALRVCCGGRGAPGKQLLTVELRHDLPEQEISDAAKSALKHTGLLSENAEVNVVMSAAASTFALPTRENLEMFEQAHRTFESLELDAEIVGGGCDFGADPLGEQIVQGLRAAEVLL